MRSVYHSISPSASWLVYNEKFSKSHIFSPIISISLFFSAFTENDSLGFRLNRNQLYHISCLLSK